MRNPQPLVEPIRFVRDADPDDSVTLYVNPQWIQIVRRKVIQQVMTNTRWVFQHWGYEPYIITCQGLTGNVVLDRIASQWSYREDYTQSAAYQVLKKLESFYSAPDVQRLDFAAITTAEIRQLARKVLVHMHYRREVFMGFFRSFSFRETEQSPWAWEYSFEFLATERCSSDLRTAGISNAELINLFKESVDGA